VCREVDLLYAIVVNMSTISSYVPIVPGDTGRWAFLTLAQLQESVWTTTVRSRGVPVQSHAELSVGASVV
jgi:hypothetical protein